MVSEVGVDVVRLVEMRVIVRSVAMAGLMLEGWFWIISLFEFV